MNRKGGIEIEIKHIHVLGGMLTGTAAGVVAGLVAGMIAMYTYDRYIHGKEVHKKVIFATKKTLKRDGKCLII